MVIIMILETDGCYLSPGILINIRIIQLHGMAFGTNNHSYYFWLGWQYKTTIISGSTLIIII